MCHHVAISHYDFFTIDFSVLALAAGTGVEGGVGLEFDMEHVAQFSLYSLPGRYMCKGLVGPDLLGSIFSYCQPVRGRGVFISTRMSEAAVWRAGNRGFMIKVRTAMPCPT
jgi:hypothetical protein